VPDAGNEPPIDVVPLTLGKAVGCSAAPGALSFFLLFLVARKLFPSPAGQGDRTISDRSR
jgi:hypothetical protein